MFASKLAAYKSAEMLEQSLENVIERLTSKSHMEWVIKKCERVGAIVVNNDKTRLLVETPIHSILRKLGSPNWCITRSKSYFDSYVGKDKRQFIHDSLNVSYDVDIDFKEEEGDFEGNDISE